MNDLANTGTKSGTLRVVIGETSAGEAQLVRASLARHYPGLSAVTVDNEQALREAMGDEPCDLFVADAAFLCTLPPTLIQSPSFSNGPTIVTAKPEERAALLSVAGADGFFPLIKHEGYTDLLPHLARNAIRSTQKFSTIRHVRPHLPPLDSLNLPAAERAALPRRTPIPEARPPLGAEPASFAAAKAGEELNRHLVSAVLRNVADWITLTDKEGRIFFVTPAVTPMLGLNPDALQGKSFKEAIGPLLCPEHQSGDPFAFLARNGGKGRLVLSGPEGRKVEVAVGANELFGPQGELLGRLIVVRDRSNEERLSRSLVCSRKNATLGLLAMGVVHDFNNLLMALTGFVQLAEQSLNEPARLASYLKNIGHAQRHASGLVQRLLRLARGEDGGETKPLDAAEALKELEPLLAQLFGKKGELSLHLTLSPPCLINLNTPELMQIAVNLVANARDALVGVAEPKLSIHVSREATPAALSMRCPQLGETLVKLVFADNGCGISKEKQQRIFEPFFTTKEVGEGTGLGLVTIKTILAAHNGLIDVESQEGQGTRFTILFPGVD